MLPVFNRPIGTHNHLLQLPKEMLINIGGFISPVDGSGAALTCRQLYDAVRPRRVVVLDPLLPALKSAHLVEVAFATADYVESLMSPCDGWERPEAEAVIGAREVADQIASLLDRGMYPRRAAQEAQFAIQLMQQIYSLWTAARTISGLAENADAVSERLALILQDGRKAKEYYANTPWISKREAWNWVVSYASASMVQTAATADQWEIAEPYLSFVTSHCPSFVTSRCPSAIGRVACYTSLSNQNVSEARKTAIGILYVATRGRGYEDTSQLTGPASPAWLTIARAEQLNGSRGNQSLLNQVEDLFRHFDRDQFHDEAKQAFERGGEQEYNLWRLDYAMLFRELLRGCSVEEILSVRQRYQFWDDERVKLVRRVIEVFEPDATAPAEVDPPVADIVAAADVGAEPHDNTGIMARPAAPTLLTGVGQLARDTVLELMGVLRMLMGFLFRRVVG